MFVLIWMHFTLWFQIWSWNSTILTFFTNFVNFLTSRLHSPTAWKALIISQLIPKHTPIIVQIVVYHHKIHVLIHTNMYKAHLLCRIRCLLAESTNLSAVKTSIIKIHTWSHTCTQKAEQIIVTERSSISVVYYQEIHQHPSDNVSITRDLFPHSANQKLIAT